MAMKRQKLSDEEDRSIELSKQALNAAPDELKLDANQANSTKTVDTVNYILHEIVERSMRNF